MNLQLVTALVILYRGCADAEIRRKALRYVPALREVLDEADLPQAKTSVRLWRLAAVADGYHIASKDIVANENDLELHKQSFAREFDLATTVRVNVRELW